MKRMLLGCAVLAVAAGCATSTAAAPQSKKVVRVVEMSQLRDTNLSPDKTYICEEGLKTGSNVRGAICQTVRERDLQRESAQEEIRRMQQAPASQRR